MFSSPSLEADRIFTFEEADHGSWGRLEHWFHCLMLLEMQDLFPWVENLTDFFSVSIWCYMEFSPAVKQKEILKISKQYFTFQITRENSDSVGTCVCCKLTGSRFSGGQRNWSKAVSEPNWNRQVLLEALRDQSRKKKKEEGKAE